MARSPKGWHKADIKAAVEKAGWTLTRLALANKLGASTCRQALREPVPAGNRAIAGLLRKPLHVLWPEWYDRAGERITAPSPRKSTRAASSGHRQIGGRA